MKRMLEFVKKLNTPLTYGIICAVFGLAFIVLPLIEPLILDLLIAVAGVVAILIGILMIPELNTPDRGLSYYLLVGKTLAFIALCLVFFTADGAKEVTVASFKIACVGH